MAGHVPTLKDIKFLILNNKEIVKFVILFIFFLLCFFIGYYLLESHLDFLNVLTAEATAYLSNIFGMEAETHGSSLMLKNFTFEVIHECTGIFALMIYFACILAYPTGWKNKLKGLLLGIPIILAINLMRMVILVYTAIHHSESFEYIHSYLWQGIFIIFVILLWILWLEKVVKYDL
jgi:archaeosortase B (VPXXXP-CTERM-specific)